MLLSSHLAMQRSFHESAVNASRLGHTPHLLLLCTSNCCVRSLLISQQGEGLGVELWSSTLEVVGAISRAVSLRGAKNRELITAGASRAGLCWRRRRARCAGISPIVSRSQEANPLDYQSKVNGLQQLCFSISFVIGLFSLYHIRW
jgi:hypothetical protein